VCEPAYTNRAGTSLRALLILLPHSTHEDSVALAFTALALLCTLCKRYATFLPRPWWVLRSGAYPYSNARTVWRGASERDARGASWGLRDGTRHQRDGVKCQLWTTTMRPERMGQSWGGVDDAMRVSLHQGVCRILTTPESGLHRRRHSTAACLR